MGKTLSQQKRPGIEQQRQAILEAAVALFSVTGAAAVSVSAISKQAGVSRDTFYRCYDNKDQLVDALYERSVSNKMLALTAAPDTDFADPAWLRQAIDGMVDDILAEHQAAGVDEVDDLAKLLGQTAEAGDDPLDAIAERVAGKAGEFLEALLEGVEHGRIAIEHASRGTATLTTG